MFGRREFHSLIVDGPEETVFVSKIMFAEYVSSLQEWLSCLHEDLDQSSVVLDIVV